MSDTLEVWLRGPVADVPSYLQPVAHALLQASEEVSAAVAGFDTRLLWIKPHGQASVGFHLQHLSGVLDRLFTYARGEVLSPQQLQALQEEGNDSLQKYTTQDLVIAFQKQVQLALKQLRETDDRTLLEPRGVGRQQIPSTMLGLLFHAAEHTQRHVGQLLVTAKVVTSENIV